MARLWITSWQTWCLLLVFFPLSVVGVFNGPISQVVKETDTAILTCSAGSGVTITFSSWFDDVGTFGTVAGLLKTTGKYANFEIVNTNTAIGQMDLRITNTQYEDEGMYSCQINADPAVPATLTVEAQVTTVTIAVNGLLMDPGASVDMAAGEQVELVCKAFGARPRVAIDWSNDGVSIPGDTEAEEPNGDTTNTISTLMFSPSKNDNGHQLECRTSGQEVATPQSQSMTLNVQFIPEVTVTHSNKLITCSSVANPEVADNEYVIILNETMSSTGKTREFIQNNNGCTMVRCNATNEIGTATKTIKGELCPDPSQPTTEMPTTGASTTAKPSTTASKGSPEPTDQSNTVTIVVVVVIVILAIVITIILSIVSYKQKKCCFSDNKTTNSGTLSMKQPSVSNADMIRNQAEVRQSVHKYDDEPKKPRIPRSSTGNSKKQPVNESPKQSGPPVAEHKGYPMDSYDGRNEESRGQGSVNYADLEFKNGQGQIHSPDEEPTQYASILV